MPLLIENDHGSRARKGGHPLVHRVGGHERPGGEQERGHGRRAELAIHLVVEAQAVDREVTAARRLHSHEFVDRMRRHKSSHSPSNMRSIMLSGWAGIADRRAGPKWSG